MNKLLAIQIINFIVQVFNLIFLIQSYPKLSIIISMISFIISFASFAGFSDFLYPFFNFSDGFFGIIMVFNLMALLPLLTIATGFYGFGFAGVVALDGFTVAVAVLIHKILLSSNILSYIKKLKGGKKK